MSTPQDPLLRREAQALAARLQRKVPAWHDAADLVLPTRLALEQCSGGAAAAYKAEVVRRLTGGRGGSMADLTGGLGVDFVHLAPVFARATYVEQRDELVRAAHHNRRPLRHHRPRRRHGMDRGAERRARPALPRPRTPRRHGAQDGGAGRLHAGRGAPHAHAAAPRPPRDGQTIAHARHQRRRACPAGSDGGACGRRRQRV